METNQKNLDYYWYYYKWHFFGCLAAIILVTYTIVSCASIVHPDLIVAYVSPNYIDQSTIQVFTQKYSEVIQDANGDGRKILDVEPMFISAPGKPSPDGQAEMAYRAKFLSEQMSDRIVMYIIDKEVVSLLSDTSIFDSLPTGDQFVPLSSSAVDELSVAGGSYVAAIRKLNTADNLTKNNELANARDLLHRLCVINK